jgi:hypothetical protein
MTRQTVDQLADELTERMTIRVEACCDGVNGVDVTIAGHGRMYLDSSAFRSLVEQDYFQLYGRGLKSTVLRQVIRNVESWVRYGPPAGRMSTEREKVT